ncbi:MAG: DUF3667 domain-containing protein [Gelidibacter sp.]
METHIAINTCKNCNQLLQDKYCHYCGEKIVEDDDFSIKTILQQTVDGVTNVDSKVIKSFKYLLFKPGRLTKLYVEGVRKPYMKPIQMFLIANVLFFFILPKADILRIPSKWYFTTELRLNALKDMSVKSGIPEQELIQLYDAKSVTYSKAAVFIIIPFVALLFALINFRKQFQFGKHVIFAIHYFAFFLLFCVLFMFIPFVDGNPLVIQTSIVTINFIYLFFAIKTFYNEKPFISGIKALIGVVGCMYIALLYRDMVSDVSFMLIK